MLTAIAMTASNSCNHIFSCATLNIVIVNEIHIIETPIIFACTGTTLSRLKSNTYFPKYLLLSNHECIFSELRENKAAASKTNGTVGNNGKKAPIIPSNKLKNPSNKNINLIKIYFFIRIQCSANCV